MAGISRSLAERFDEALNPRLMGPRLSAALRGGPQTCHLVDAKFEPGVRALLLYQHGNRLLRGDLLSAPDEAAQEQSGPGVVVPPGVRIRVFPDDPELPGLPDVMNGARLGRLLGEAGVPRGGSRVTLLRYRPGKRATVLVKSGQGPDLITKVYHNPAKAAAVVEEAEALATATADTQRLRFAPTVGHLPDLGLVVQRRVSGTPLDALIGTTRPRTAGAQQGVRRAAQALVELHALPVVSRRPRSVDKELRRFVLRAERVSTVDPALGASLADMAYRLSRVQSELPPATTGLVHGDCKPSQFLLSGREVVLLDLDHCGVSDQAADVGTFLATLRQLAVRNALARRSPARRDELGALAEEFRQAYVEGKGDCRMHRRIRWQEAVALERKALRAFARAPRSPLAGALVKEGEECLNDLSNLG